MNPPGAFVLSHSPSLRPVWNRVVTTDNTKRRRKLEEQAPKRRKKGGSGASAPAQPAAALAAAPPPEAWAKVRAGPTPLPAPCCVDASDALAALGAA